MTRLKKIKGVCLLVTFLSLVPEPALAMQTAAPEWSVPKSYIFGYKLLLSFVLTAYYTTMDANKQSADFMEWKIDQTTASNIAWRTVLYGGINYCESLVRELAPIKEKGWDAFQNYRISLVKTSASMITYNTRYDETIIKRHAGFLETLEPYFAEPQKSQLAAIGLLLTNVAWFFVVPMLWSPRVTTFYNRYTPNPTHLARGIQQGSGSIALGLASYTVLDLLTQHILISIKQAFTSVFPGAADLRPFRFSDCTSCFFTTDLLGRRGLIGRPLFWVRNQIVDSCARAYELAWSKDEL